MDSLTPPPLRQSGNDCESISASPDATLTSLRPHRITTTTDKLPDSKSEYPLPDLASAPTFHFLEWTTELPPSISAQLPTHIQALHDPLTWSPQRKRVTLTMACLTAFLAAWVAGAYTAGMEAMEREFGVSKLALLGGLMLFSFGFSVAPMLLAPLSEIYGRRPMFLATFALANLCHLITALTPSYALLMVGRLLLGVGASTFSSMVGGVISDVYPAASRGLPMSLFTSSVFSSTGVAAMVSAYVGKYWGWRWIHWLQLIMGGVCLGMMWLWWPETRGIVLLRRRAQAVNTALEKNGDRSGVRWKVRDDETEAGVLEMVRVSLTRPFYLLFTEPVVFWFSMWTAFAWGISYLFLDAIPTVFQEVYNFNNTQIGLVFLSMVAGTIIANILNYTLETLSDHHFRNHPPDPERRLYVACVISITFPLGLFWFGWTSTESISPLVPTVSIACCTIGIYSIYLAVFNYFADTYRSYASSVLAAQSFCRNMMAGAFPLVTDRLFYGLGFGAASSLLGGVGAALTVVPWVLVFYGERIRARSRFAKGLED